MVEPTRRAPGGRRAVVASRRRPSPLTVLSVVLPVLTVAALALVRPAAAPVIDQVPDERPLARASVVCPAATGDATRISLGSSGRVTGAVTLRIGGNEAETDLVQGVGQVSRTKPVVVWGEGDVAPGLLATRSGGNASVVCAEPAADQWFTGLGAGPRHSSVVSFTNPDRGPAVADVTVLGPDGVVDVPALRGVTVPGGATRTYDLARVVPMTGALAVRVDVNRGRLATHVVDQLDSLGRGDVVQGWIAPQTEPADTSYLVGIAPDRATRVLTLANPGDSEVRVEVALVTDTSEFVPTDTDEVRVRPGSVVEVDLSRMLRGKGASGTRALRVTATGAVTAALRTETAGAAVAVPAGEWVESEVAVALPPGDKRLVVAGATTPGVLTVRAWAADGSEIGDATRVEVDPGVAVEVVLPPRAVLVSAVLDRTAAVLAVEVGARGSGVLPLGELVLTSQVPHVRPALR